MKTNIILGPAVRLLTMLLVVVSFALPLHVFAQDGDYAEPIEQYSPEELTQMLAPIALYPDALLSQVLMASTYPIEVIEADRWVKMRTNLEGEQLDNELLAKNWDPSVKAICHFPSILSLMSERISETTDLGNAFLAQESEVLDMVQELRAKAYSQGNLVTSPQQNVIVERETIIIEPASPEVIYVPYYDPFSVYGPWWYPAYPPYFWGPPGISYGIGFSYWPGFYFGLTYSNWCYFDWHYRYVYIDVYKRPRYVHADHWAKHPGRWNHSPAHRRGVAYQDKSTARKFGQRPNPQREFRKDARGFPDRNRQDQRSVELNKAGSNRPDKDRSRTVLPTIDRDRQNEKKAVRERQVDHRVEQNRQSEPTVGRETKNRNSATERNRIEAELQRRQSSDNKKQQAQSRVVVEKQPSPPIETAGRDRQQDDHSSKSPRRAERSEPSRRQVEVKDQRQDRENVFGQVEDGNQARTASERGRVSRQGQSNDSRNRSPYSMGSQRKNEGNRTNDQRTHNKR